MDPIRPIGSPAAPTIGPVAPAPRVGRTTPDGRGGGQPGGRGGRRPARGDSAPRPDDDVDRRDEGPDIRPHIDITA